MNENLTYSHEQFTLESLAETPMGREAAGWLADRDYSDVYQAYLNDALFTTIKKYPKLLAIPVAAGLIAVTGGLIDSKNAKAASGLESVDEDACANVVCGATSWLLDRLDLNVHHIQSAFADLDDQVADIQPTATPLPNTPGIMGGPELPNDVDGEPDGSHFTQDSNEASGSNEAVDVNSQPELRPTVQAISVDFTSFDEPDRYPDVDVDSTAGGEYLNPEAANRSLALLAQYTGRDNYNNMRVVEHVVSGEGIKGVTNTSVAVLEQADGSEVFLWWSDKDGKIGFNPDLAPVAMDEGAKAGLTEGPIGTNLVVFGEFNWYFVDETTGLPVAEIIKDGTSVGELGNTQLRLHAIDPETRLASDIEVRVEDGRLFVPTEDVDVESYYDPDRNEWVGLDFTVSVDSSAVSAKMQAELNSLGITYSPDSKLGTDPDGHAFEAELVTNDHGSALVDIKNNTVKAVFGENPEWVNFSFDGENFDGTPEELIRLNNFLPVPDVSGTLFSGQAILNSANGLDTLMIIPNRTGQNLVELGRKNISVEGLGEITVFRFGLGLTEGDIPILFAMGSLNDTSYSKDNQITRYNSGRYALGIYHNLISLTGKSVNAKVYAQKLLALNEGIVSSSEMSKLVQAIDEGRTSVATPDGEVINISDVIFAGVFANEP